MYIYSNSHKGLKVLGQGVGLLGGLSTSQVTGDGTSFISAGLILIPNGRVVTIPISVPFQVIGRLVILDDWFFQLALSSARGTSQGQCNRCVVVMVTSSWLSPRGLTGVLRLP
jgi:hypothetical protein